MQIALLVIDSGGIGAAPDAGRFGDAGANTIGHTAQAVGGLALPHLAAMGLTQLLPVAGTAATPLAGRARRLHPQSAGKDTLAGHWEMMGLLVDRPFPTYPDGFPPEVVARLEAAWGRPILGNEAASGTEIIARLGRRHLETGYPIVYTSADSVLQVACHEAVVPVDQLYRWCEAARAIMQGPHRVGRIIARPFVGEPGAFVRTPRRRDFAVPPDGPTQVEALQARGVETWAIGKIGDIFSGRGFDHHRHTRDNADGLEKTRQLLTTATREGQRFVFTNLVDFDSQFGHRRDPFGYARALAALDAFLPRLWEVLGPRDQLWITADHGCDPTFAGSDHTREDVPWLMYGPAVQPGVEEAGHTLADIGATLAALWEAPVVGPGRPLPASAFSP